MALFCEIHIGIAGVRMRRIESRRRFLRFVSDVLKTLLLNVKSKRASDGVQGPVHLSSSCGSDFSKAYPPSSFCDFRRSLSFFRAPAAVAGDPSQHSTSLIQQSWVILRLNLVPVFFMSILESALFLQY